MEGTVFTIPGSFVQYDAGGDSGIERFYLRRVRDGDGFIHLRHQVAGQARAFITKEDRGPGFQIGLIEWCSFVRGSRDEANFLGAEFLADFIQLRRF